MRSPALRYSRALYSSNPIPRGCVFYAPLWSPGCSGPVFKSIDPFGHTCTVTGALWKSNGRLFDGTDDYINCGHNSNLNITGDISVGIWFKGTTGDYNADDGLVTKWDVVGAGKRSYSLKFSGGELWTVQLSDDGSFIAGHIKSYKGSDVFDGTQHHLFFTFDASESELLMYEDGTVITPTKTNDDAITSLHSNNADTLIGAELNSGAARRFIKALVDETCIYNRVLSASEVSYIHEVTRWRHT